MKKIYLYGSLIIASTMRYPVYAMKAAALEEQKAALVTPASVPAVQAAGSAAQASQGAAVPLIEKVIEKAVEKKERLLDKKVVRVENKTNDSILVRTITTSAVLRESTLIPEQCIDFSLDELVILQVKPYGIYKEWISAETLRLQLPNLIDLVKTQGERLCTPRVKLSVRPYWNASVSGRLAYLFAFACEKTLPYTYVCDYTEQLDEYTSLDEVFPQLARAVKEGRIDEPRLALNIGLHHGENTVNVYTHLHKPWTEKIQSRDPETKKFALDVLAIMHAAYQALLDRQRNLETFKRLVQKHFIDERRTYSVWTNNPHAEQLLREFLEEKGISVLRAAQCHHAIKALNELKVSWPRFKAFMQTRSANHAAIYLLCRKYFPQAAGNSLRSIDIVHIAFALGTPEARDWFVYVISKANPTRQRGHEDFDVAYKILQRFDCDFYKPLVEELTKQQLSLAVVDEQGNSLLMRAVIEENIELALFLMKYPLPFAIANNGGKTALQLVQEKREDLVATYDQSPPILQKYEKLIELLRQRLK